MDVTLVHGRTEPEDRARILEAEFAISMCFRIGNMSDIFVVLGGKVARCIPMESASVARKITRPELKFVVG